MVKRKAIYIDQEVFGKLQEKAVSMNLRLSNPNNIIRILLGLPPDKGPIHQPK